MNYRKVKKEARISVWNSVWDLVRDSVWYLVRDSVQDSVWDSVRNSVHKGNSK